MNVTSVLEINGGDVDHVDYLALKVNFGRCLPPAAIPAAGAESVPEPATLCLLALAAALPRRRRRQAVRDQRHRKWGRSPIMHRHGDSRPA